jgi:hypothetical protein
VAEELGVRYVLEGSVKRANNQIRITAQLANVITGHHLWAERYDRDLKEIFAIQDGINNIAPSFTIRICIAIKENCSCPQEGMELICTSYVVIPATICTCTPSSNPLYTLHIKDFTFCVIGFSYRRFD